MIYIYICLIILSIAVLISYTAIKELFKIINNMMDVIKTLQIAVSALLEKSKLDKKIKDKGNDE